MARGSHRCFRASGLGLVLLLVVAGTGRAHAQTAPDDRAAASASAEYIDRRLAELQRLTRELEAQKADLEEGIEASDVRREALTTKLEELGDLLARAETRLDAADARLAGTQARLDAKAKELERSKRLLDLTVERLELRAVSMYKHGPASLVDFVVEADDLRDLVRKFSFAVHLADTDNRILHDVQEEKEAILRAWEVIDDLRGDQAEEVARQRAERDRVAGIKRVVDGERAAVASELQEQYAELGDVEAQKRKYSQETQQLRSESASIAAFLRGRTDTPPTVSPKGMSWPVRGPVTSGFGWRTHPIFGAQRFHAGIDVGAPTGTAIGAAASGQVIFAGQKPGYGSHVIVYHGGGISTLYGHMSSIGAGNGAQVTRGETIGAVGCTGYCTGPHLHFEVRVNGEPRDPMGWLP